MPVQLFPRGVATGLTFINRKNELNSLSTSISKGEHSMIVSPRRYGKTSLVKKVIEKLKISHGIVDLFLVVDEAQTEKLILSGINKIIKNLDLPLTKKVTLLTNYFLQKKLKWSIGTNGTNIELQPASSNTSIVLMEALQALESLLSKKKESAVLFIDEIQEIVGLKTHRAIEGALRNVMQETKYLSVVFSGSRQHLISDMFFSKDRPLYKLCNTVWLQKIPADEYKQYLRKESKKRWGSFLSDDVIKRILFHTECYPYYVNILCNSLWDSNKLPGHKDVDKYWYDYIVQSKVEVIKNLELLNQTQRMLLINMAYGKTGGFTSKETLRKFDLSVGGIQAGLRDLVNKDYIEKLSSGKYLIIDPLLKASVREVYEKY